MVFFPFNLDDFSEQIKPILSQNTQDFYLDELFDFFSGVAEQKYIKGDNDYFLNIKSLDFLTESNQFLLASWKIYLEESIKKKEEKKLNEIPYRKIDRSKVLLRSDLLITTKGELRCISMSNFFDNLLGDERFLANNQLIVARPRSFAGETDVKLDVEFLHYLLLNSVIYTLKEKKKFDKDSTNDINQIENSNNIFLNKRKFSGSHIFGIKDFIGMKVIIPTSLEEQRMIVQKFRDTENKIKNAELELQNFKDKFAAEVYKSWDRDED
jgi:hypothetical protein